MAELNSARKHQFLEKTKKDAQERRRNILHLILSYLNDHGLQKTAECLEEEANIGQVYETCENIDLDIILQEYQSYYMAKFQKSPKIIRKVCELHPKKPSVKKTKKTAPKDDNNSEKGSDVDFQFEIVSLSSDNNVKILKAPDAIENYSGEWKEFAQAISREIVRDTNTKFSDCIGLDHAVECLKEAAVYPTVYPSLFKSLDEPWNGILLYGPPGNGKTLLAKALANETQSTLINLSNSTFISKWRGESEKMLKVLFEMALHYAPTVIFIDEIDAMTFEGNHEASRRFKSELLVQMDGILKVAAPILILATTNHPWSLDKATLRRFEKRILVNVPNEQGRLKLFEYYLKKYNGGLSNEDFIGLSRDLKRFSAYDIKTVCKEARMSVIREKIKERKDFVPGKINVNHVKAALGKIRPCINEDELEKYKKWAEEYGST